MSKKQKGRHQSTDKHGKRSLMLLRGLPGVVGVVIGISKGGKRIGANPAGHVKLQRQVQGGYKALLQTSRGVQELFIQTEATANASVKDSILELWPE